MTGQRMRKFFSFFLIILFFASCLSEDGTTPAKPATFVRYYSGGYGDQAVGFEKTADNGFIILANTTPGDRKKIKLIKTDDTGAPLWQKVYPDFGSVVDYSAAGIQILQDGGYVVTGSEINSQKLLLLRVDANGAVVKNVTFGPPDFIDSYNPTGISATGISVALNAAGNYIVLGKSVPTDQMILMETNKDDLSKIWFFSYRELGNPATGMFIDENQKVYWARLFDFKSRVIKIGQQSQLSDYDRVVTNPGIVEFPSDFCRYGSGFALAGTDINSRIFFRKISQDGTVLKYRASLPDSTVSTTGNYVSYQANSISSTQDGGLIILSTASTTAGLEETQDLYIVKIDALGNQRWTSALGSTKFKDMGAAVRQTGDGAKGEGGYAILGTTTQGGLDMIVFIKTSLEGKVE